jgi:hypothetical protein
MDKQENLKKTGWQIRQNNTTDVRQLYKWNNRIVNKYEIVCAKGCNNKIYYFDIAQIA